MSIWNSETETSLSFERVIGRQHVLGSDVLRCKMVARFERWDVNARQPYKDLPV